MFFCPGCGRKTDPWDSHFSESRWQTVCMDCLAGDCAKGLRAVKCVQCGRSTIMLTHLRKTPQGPICYTCGRGGQKNV